MATEAQNIMDAFYAEQKRAEVQKEERGLYGDRYVGGAPGFIADVSSAFAGGSALMSFGQAGENILDQRPFDVKVEDELKKLNKLYGSEVVEGLLEKKLENMIESSIDLRSDRLRKFGFISDEVVV